MAADAPILSPAQRKLVGFALGFAAVAGIVALGALTLHYLAVFVSAFSSVIWPLAVAGILALILRPLVAILEKRLGIRRVIAITGLYGVFLLLLAALFFKFTPVIVAQLLDFIAYVPALWKNSVAWTEANFPEWLATARRYLENPAVRSAADALVAHLQDLAAQIAPSLRSAGSGVLGFFGFVASLAIIPVYLFFFLLTDAEPAGRLRDHLPFLDEPQRDDVVFLAREFLGILVAFFRGQLLIGLIMGVLLALGFTLGGLKAGLALGLLLGLLNIVPYLGTILGLSIVLPLALFQPDGGVVLFGLCLLIFIAVQAVEGWLLTPRIMGAQTGLHPVAIIVAVFFWGQALGGILGMVLAVPLTAFFVTAWRLIRRKYFSGTASRPGKADHLTS